MTDLKACPGCANDSLGERKLQSLVETRKQGEIPLHTVCHVCGFSAPSEAWGTRANDERIAELEKQRDELAAHVDRLRAYIVQIATYRASEAGESSVGEYLPEWIDETPAQSMQHIKQQATAELERELEEESEWKTDFHNGLVQEMQKTAELEQKLAAEREANRWIPIEEQLPKAGAQVLVYAPDWEGLRVHLLAPTALTLEIFKGENHHPFLSRVTHWREIKPPTDANG